MANDPSENIQNLFDSIAPDYDYLNHLLSLGIDKTWRRRAIRQIKGRADVIDIACGTGDFSILIARKTDACVTGLDLSEGMLQVMAEKVRKAGLADRITAEQGNCEHMRFEDGSFDCATIAFGVRNFAHREAALTEILRILKPGGKLVILELSVPENRFIRWCYNLYFTKILPLIGGRISGNNAAYRYLPASVLKFPPKKEWMAKMSDCGYLDITHRSFTLGICRMYTGTKKI